MKIIDKFLCFVFVCFVLFPYIEIIPLPSYNQPYAFISSVFYCFINYKLLGKLLNKKIVLWVCLFTLIGLISFLLTCYPYNVFQEYKYLVTYLSFSSITIASIISIIKHKQFVLKICLGALFTWFTIALVQMVYSPSFMTSVIGQFGHGAENLGSSGRGVLGLAPEPTHHGFHMIFLGLILLVFKQSNKLVLLCIFEALVFAQSSSVFMALTLAFVVYFVFSKLNIVKIGIITAIVLTGPKIMSIILTYLQGMGNSNRMGYLLRLFMENPTALLVLDYSVNNRIGAPIATINSISSDFFMPHGLSNHTWMMYRQVIFDDNPWLFALSHSGVPSGIGIILYQCGFIMIPIIFIVFRKMLQVNVDKKFNWLKVSVCFIMFNQFTFATPIVCFFLGLAIKEGFSNIKISNSYYSKKLIVA